MQSTVYTLLETVDVMPLLRYHVKLLMHFTLSIFLQPPTTGSLAKGKLEPKGPTSPMAARGETTMVH